MTTPTTEPVTERTITDTDPDSGCLVAPADADPEAHRCPCGSEYVTYGGGGFPWTCAEAFFALTDDHAIHDDGDPIPTAAAVLAARCMCSQCRFNRGLYDHLIRTQVWEVGDPGLVNVDRFITHQLNPGQETP